jgi:ferredoxin
VSLDAGTLRFHPVIDEDACTGCRQCVDACPTGALVAAESYTCEKCVKYCLGMDVPCRPANLVVRPRRCDGCGQCVAICPAQAIQIREGGVDAPSVSHVHRDGSAIRARGARP